MRKTILLLLLSTVFFFCTGCAVNPISGERQLMFLSEDQDVEIGRKYAPEVEKEMGGAIADRALQNYVDSVGQSVARVSHKPYFDYHFVALNDKSVNAFALPGGRIFVTKGMLEELGTEAQLAAILAHEVTHVVARHSSAAMSSQIGVDILLSAIISEDTPQTVSTVASLTRQIVSLKYSRKDEREADLVGLDYMVSAGYNPYAMIETMQMLESQKGARPIEFLSTHPAPENRIEYLTETLNERGYDLDGLRVGERDYQTNVIARLTN
jgi:predicted Zn-dependent protease